MKELTKRYRFFKNDPIPPLNVFYQKRAVVNRKNTLFHIFFKKKRAFLSDKNL